ncbi:MAG: response regulator transcription factor [Anaerolineae bacterium]|nr:response regulator transcription factor [Anaerolineae bacterium]
MSANGAEDKIRLFIVDDNTAVRRALEARLSRVPDFELLGGEGDVNEALNHVGALKPDVLLVESKRRDGNGLRLCQQVLEMDDSPEIILLTSFIDEDEQLAAASLGLHRYVLKDIASSELICTIHDAYTERCTRHH